MSLRDRIRQLEHRVKSLRERLVGDEDRGVLVQQRIDRLEIRVTKLEDAAK